MIPSLNNNQRLALAIAGTAIIGVQLVSIADDGVRGIGWVIAFVVGIILVLPILGRSKSPKPLTPLAASDGAKVVANPTKDLLEVVRYRSSTLWERLPQWAGVPLEPLPRTWITEATEAMTGSWITYCYTYVLSLVLIAETKKDRLFSGSDREKDLTLAVIQLVLDSYRDTAQQLKAPELYNRETALGEAAKEVAQARRLMRVFVDAIVKGDASPDAPLIDFLAEKLPVSPEKRPHFDERLREFTKDTLRALSNRQ